MIHRILHCEPFNATLGVRRRGPSGQLSLEGLTFAGGPGWYRLFLADPGIVGLSTGLTLFWYRIAAADPGYSRLIPALLSLFGLEPGGNTFEVRRSDLLLSLSRRGYWVWLIQVPLSSLAMLTFCFYLTVVF